MTIHLSYWTNSIIANNMFSVWLFRGWAAWNKQEASYSRFSFSLSTNNFSSQSLTSSPPSITSQQHLDWAHHLPKQCSSWIGNQTLEAQWCQPINMRTHYNLWIFLPFTSCSSPSSLFFSLYLTSPSFSFSLLASPNFLLSCSFLHPLSMP